MKLLHRAGTAVLVFALALQAAAVLLAPLLPVLIGLTALAYVVRLLVQRHRF